MLPLGHSQLKESTIQISQNQILEFLMKTVNPLMKEELNSEFQEDGELSQILKQPNHLLDKFAEF